MFPFVIILSEQMFTSKEPQKDGRYILVDIVSPAMKSPKRDIGVTFGGNSGVSFFESSLSLKVLMIGCPKLVCL